MFQVVILGPECCGKSTLCQQLAEHYNTVWSPEFAREYLSTRGKNYSYEDLLNIAIGQIELEEVMKMEASEIYFIDSDMYSVKVWCEVAFNNCHPWILNQIANRKYDLHLLCNPDLPWKQSMLREHPDPETRLKHYKMFKDLLVNDGGEWGEISGRGIQRFNNAISIIDKVFSGHKIHR